MNYPSPRSSPPATGWIYKDFKQARKKLVLLYLLIMAGIISLFSFLLIGQLEERDEIQSLSQNSQIMTPEPEEGGLIETLTDDLGEVIWWIALLMFLISALASFLIAHYTLKPIASSIEKQKRFMGDAAHELRNPLAAIHSTLESALRDPRKSSGDKEILGDLLSETKRLIAISESLLDIERQAGKKLHAEDISLEEVLSAVLLRIKPLLEEKHIHLIKEVGSAYLHIDKEDLHTILYNLLSNAVKFSHDKGTISVVWKDEKLTIKDNGIGIAEKHVPHIFERFYKADPARGFTYAGSGLGLALVREIVQKYEGKIEVESVLSQGTTFTISFS